MASISLVTGGAGFIGSHLVRALLERGDRVRVLDNFSTGRRENISEVRRDIELIEGDIRDQAACAESCRSADTVFHLAALGSVPRSIDDPLTTNAVNVIGALNMLVGARDAGVRRFVFSSSSSIYGDTPILPKHEAMRPTPRSPYAVSKLAGEEYCRAFHLSYGMETVVLRYFNIFGPRQDPDSQYAAAIPRFITAMLEGRRPVIYGDGKQSRDFTFVSNAVDANLRAAVEAQGPGGIFNVAGGERITVLELLDAIKSRLRVQSEYEFRPARNGDIKHSLADVSAAQLALGYTPRVRFREGIAETVSYYVSEAGATTPRRTSSASNMKRMGVGSTLQTQEIVS
jgi:nucleoside-diphosphate-sugar epimerase